MKKRNLLFALILIATVMICASEAVASTPEPTANHAIWAELLHKHIKPNGVDYAGFKSEEERLNRYLKVLEATDSKRLAQNDRFAFYVNAYNAWTIKLILSAYPAVKSIKELGSFFESPWQKKFVRLDGDVISLDDIEHHILRPRFKDPRVHFAINCSAVSCPPLRPEPYLGESLEQQLDDSSRSFINNPANTRFDGRKLYVSRIFKWFSEDFNDDVVGFYLKYAEGDLKKQIAQKKDALQIEYLRYDWSLNDAQNPHNRL